MVVMGRIVAPFGVQGWLKIHPFGDDPQSWRTMSHWWICADPDAPDSQWSQRALGNCRVHGKGLIATLEGVPDRNAAEAVEGWYVAAPRDALPKTGVDEYYWGDLVGLTVFDEAGDTLGTVSGLLSTGAHDVLQVQDGDEERLIPFVAAYILEVDLAARSIRTAWQKDW